MSPTTIIVFFIIGLGIIGLFFGSCGVMYALKMIGVLPLPLSAIFLVCGTGTALYTLICWLVFG